MAWRVLTFGCGSVWRVAQGCGKGVSGVFDNLLYD
jgi:hypothetical protein